MTKNPVLFRIKVKDIANCHIKRTAVVNSPTCCTFETLYMKSFTQHRNYFTFNIFLTGLTFDAKIGLIVIWTEKFLLPDEKSTLF